MKRISIILSFILLLVSYIQAQEEEKETVTMPRFRLGVEAGVDAFFGKINKPAMIRESQSYYYDYDYDYNCGFISGDGEFDNYYFGLRPEYSLNRRIAVSAGLRFTFNKASLNSDRDYFLWKIAESETSANYIKINNISQKKYYIGIPIEIKLFPRELDYFTRNYFILGVVSNFLVSSTNDVSFQNAAMKKYSSEVSRQIGSLNRFQGYFYLGAGLKMGRTNHPFGNLEIHLPVYMFGNDNSNSFTRIKNTFGIGIQTTLQIPLFPKRQLKYIVITN